MAIEQERAQVRHGSGVHTTTACVKSGALGLLNPCPVVKMTRKLVAFRSQMIVRSDSLPDLDQPGLGSRLLSSPAVLLTDCTILLKHEAFILTLPRGNTGITLTDNRKPCFITQQSLQLKR